MDDLSSLHSKGCSYHVDQYPWECDCEYNKGRCYNCDEDEIDGGVCKYCGWPDNHVNREGVQDAKPK